MGFNWIIFNHELNLNAIQNIHDKNQSKNFVHELAKEMFKIIMQLVDNMK